MVFLYNMNSAYPTTSPPQLVQVTVLRPLLLVEVVLVTQLAPAPHAQPALTDSSSSVFRSRISVSPWLCARRRAPCIQQSIQQKYSAHSRSSVFDYLNQRPPN